MQQEKMVVPVSVVATLALLQLSILAEEMSLRRAIVGLQVLVAVIRAMLV